VIPKLKIERIHSESDEAIKVERTNGTSEITIFHKDSHEHFHSHDIFQSFIKMCQATKLPWLTYNNVKLNT